jgi:alkaline phosphatase D
MSASLPTKLLAPVGVEFVTGSVSAPGFLEALGHRALKENPFAEAYVPGINFTCRHGIAAGLALAGGEAAARAKSNPEVAPHLSFIDWGGHGYTVVRASADALEAEFVCIPRPVERSAGEDGGPLRYRVRHRAALWKGGEAPKLEQTIVEGDATLSI